MKSIDLFAALDCIPESYIHEAATYRRRRSSYNPLHFILIAAIIVTLATTAYAVVIRNLNWTTEEQEILTPYNEETQLGAVAMDWYIDDVDITISIAQSENSELSIFAKTWSQNAEGVLETGSEYWIEKWNGTSYEEIATLDGKPWIIPKQSLECNDELNWTADYAPSYGQLEAGNYRLGMMITLVDPNGQQSEKGCYAKFQVYTADVKPYVDAYVKAFYALANGETYHVRIAEHYESDSIADDKYNITDLWKAGRNYLDHSVTYSLEDDSFIWDFGYIMQNGQKYQLEWGASDTTPTPKNIQSAGDLTAENFTLLLSEFDYFSRGVDSVTENGEEIIFMKAPAAIVQKVYGEDDNTVELQAQELHVCYDASGNIQVMTFINHGAYTLKAEVISEDADEIRSFIESIDITVPTEFSYAQEMEALVHLAYEKKISDFVNTTPLASLNRDTALQRAKEECSRSDYNVDSVSYDKQANMWKIEFGISWDSYVYEVVYLDAVGIPQMVAIRPNPGMGESLLPKPSEWAE